MDIPPAGPMPPMGRPESPQSSGVPVLPGGQGEQPLQETTWMGVVQAILAKIPTKHLVRNLIKGRTRPEGAEPIQKPEKPPEEEMVSKQVIPKVFKPEQSHAPSRPEGKAQEIGKAPSENASVAKAVKECSEGKHTYSLKELKERISDVFARRDISKNEKPPLPPALAMLPDHRYRLDDRKVMEKSVVEKPEEKEKLEEKERLALDRTREKEKPEEGRFRDTDAERVQVADSPSQPTILLDKVPPQLLFGLTLPLSVAERITSSPAFKSAKAAVLVQGACEKLVLTHFLQFYGHLKKSVYIWELGHETAFSDAWVLLGRLRMPCIALLDLELGRNEGGWHQIKYLLRKMLAFQGGKLGDLTEEEISRLPFWDSPASGMDAWIALLERFGVFLTTPLDFDFLLLREFPEAYGAVVEKQSGAWKHVLDIAPEVLGGYSSQDLSFLESYHKLFFQQNRLVTHQEALRRIGTLDVIRLMPKVLERLLRRLSVLAIGH